MTKKIFSVSLELREVTLNQVDPTPVQVHLSLPLDATIMHDNMLNVQRQVNDLIYELFKRYHS